MIKREKEIIGLDALLINIKLIIINLKLSSYTSENCVCNILIILICFSSINSKIEILIYLLILNLPNNLTTILKKVLFSFVNLK